MKEIQFTLICFIFAFSLSSAMDVIIIKKQLKELKEIKMTVETVESQIKLLTPPPEFFKLPVIKRP